MNYGTDKFSQIYKKFYTTTEKVKEKQATVMDKTFTAAF